VTFGEHAAAEPGNHEEAELGPPCSNGGLRRKGGEVEEGRLLADPKLIGVFITL